jgi:hypothetical protein
MTTTTTTVEVDPGRPLSEATIDTIIQEHRQQVPESVSSPLRGLTASYSLPSVPKGYATTDGRYVGCPLVPEIAEHSHQLVIVADDRIPSADELRRVRVAADGTVSWMP